MGTGITLCCATAATAHITETLKLRLYALRGHQQTTY
jgi:hypothetical protein